jgi:hypothetical protein
MDFVHHPIIPTGHSVSEIGSISFIRRKGAEDDIRLGPLESQSRFYCSTIDSDPPKKKTLVR